MTAAPRAEVLAIGDELTHGVSIDTNSAHIARELELLGLEVRAFTVVSDEPDALRDAIAGACGRAAVVVATGGLGPTEDDRTRAAAAAAAGVELRFDEESWQHIEGLFRARGLEPPASNRVQAWLPAGAEVVQNDRGTAPGFALAIGEAVLFSLPGVPREMKPMLAERVLPRLRRQFAGAGTTVLQELRVVGLHEAEVGERLADLMRAGGETRVGVTAHWGVHTVRVATHLADEAAARARCEATMAVARERLREFVVWQGPETLPEAVVRRLRETRSKLALAESCTGGLVSQLLTGVAGVSEVFVAGLVSYADAAKRDFLGVPASAIAAHGAVSPVVAAAMARGVRERSGADLAVAITGIAGPGGGSAEKPVGMVCFGVARCQEDGAETASAWARRFPALGREFVRQRSASEAFVALLRVLRGEDAQPPPVR